MIARTKIIREAYEQKKSNSENVLTAGFSVSATRRRPSSRSDRVRALIRWMKDGREFQ